MLSIPVFILCSSLISFSFNSKKKSTEFCVAVASSYLVHWSVSIGSVVATQNATWFIIALVCVCVWMQLNACDDAWTAIGFMSHVHRVSHGTSPIRTKEEIANSKSDEYLTWINSRMQYNRCVFIITLKMVLNYLCVLFSVSVHFQL